MRLVDGRSWAVLPTLAINFAVFAQILSFQGLVLWVVSTSIVSWFVVSVCLKSHRRTFAWIAGLLMPLAFAALAEFIGGTSSGSIARAAFLSCGLTSAAAIMGVTHYSRLLLVPMTFLLVSALALGATGNAVAWVGAWVVAAGFSLMILGPYSEHELLPCERLRFVAIVMGIGGLAAVVGTAAATALVQQPWIVHPKGLTLQTEDPPSLPSVGVGTGRAETPSQAPANPSDLLNSLGSFALKAFGIIAIALIIWLVIGIGRRLLVVIGWRLELRQLETGFPREQVLGAWTWTRLKLAQHDQPLPLHLSPDVAVSWAADNGQTDLAKLAELVAPVAFSGNTQPTPEQASRAWELAYEIDYASRGTTWRQRWTWSLRSINATRLDLEHQTLTRSQRAADVSS